ncbi:MAG: hypothetical protein JM57_01580 [Comamonadaceae bacterium BICA1-1]|nr:MAG: hypothetical protein JM57_01580 [Comamonadaceae bacterium BICA1-1]
MCRCQYPQLIKDQFTPTEISHVMCHDPGGPSRQREFNQMIVGFIGKIWAPSIVDRHPPAAIGQCCQNLLPFLSSRCGTPDVPP